MEYKYVENAVLQEYVYYYERLKIYLDIKLKGLFGKNRIDFQTT